ncbi:hypothetical protein [Olegusella massiliensis]|uniref:hypothetical protein n=1 Tax=Olegusella massiliensis TaxID=1776381 RepID=UPI001E3F9DDA|nr:hypothetical protein [Olegusella massiliensis]
MLLDLVVDGSQLLGDAFLFGFQEIQRDRIVVVGFEELLALMFQLPLPAEQAIDL